MQSTGEEITNRIMSLYPGMSQLEVAAEIGIGQSGLSGWKSGKSDPRIKHLLAISKSKRTSIDWILTGKGRKTLDDTTDQEKIDECNLELTKLFSLLSEYHNMALCDGKVAVWLHSIQQIEELLVKLWKASQSDGVRDMG